MSIWRRRAEQPGYARRTYFTQKHQTVPGVGRRKLRRAMEAQTEHFLATNGQPLTQPQVMLPLPELQLAIALRYVDHIVKYKKMGKKSRWFIPHRVRGRIGKYQLIKWRRRHPHYQ